MNLSFGVASKRILQFMLPILLTMLTVAGMNAIDIIMSGHASTAELAGVSVGNSIWFPIYTGFNGVIIALTTIIAHLLGQNKPQEVSTALKHGLYLAILTGATIIFFINLIISNINYFITIEPYVQEVAVGYIRAISWGVIPLCVCNTLRQFIEALNFARIISLVYLSALPLNALINYGLIFGNWGLPKLGGIGAGYATSITYTIICLILLIIVTQQQPFASYRIFQSIRLDYRIFFEQLRLGLPIGFSIFLEMSIFSLTALIISKFGTVTIAANQAAFSAVTIIYMFLLSLSIALNIIISYELGANNPVAAKQFAHYGLKFSLFLSLAVIILLFFTRAQVAALYSNDPTVQILIQDFLVYVLFYQLADAILTPSQGILRAYKDVNMAFYIALISYWLVCFPIGYILDNYYNFGAVAYWNGFVCGMSVGALISLYRINYLQKTSLPKI